MPAHKGTRPPNAGKGRPKGAANTMTRTLREMILGALDAAGGQTYLAEQAQKNPAAFMVLLGKVLPMQIGGTDGGPIIIATGVVCAEDDTGEGLPADIGCTGAFAPSPR
jgi:hypothetical protein